MTIRECHRAGMTIQQAASSMGVSYHCAIQRAKARGLTFVKDRGLTAFRARLRNDPEFAARRSALTADQARKQHADPKIDMRPKHLRGLTEAQLAQYRVHRAARMPKAEALAAVGVKAWQS